MRRILSIVLASLALLCVLPRWAAAGCCQNSNQCSTAFAPGQCVGTFYPSLTCPLPNVPNVPCLGQPVPGPCTSNADCSDGVPSTCDLCAPNISSPGGAFVCTSFSACDDGNPCTDDTCDSAGGAFACHHTNNTAPCDDGHACTVGDACAGGVCVGGPPPDCNDHDPCTTDTCGSVGGAFLCQHAPNGNPCDDGNRCTTNDRCIPGGCIGDPDLQTCHYECYEVKKSPFVGPAVSLTDQFGTSSAGVQRPERLCAPADKNDEDPPAPANPEHLAGYRIRHTFTPRLRQRVVDQFGSQLLDVTKVDRLLVPSAKSLTGPIPPLATVTTDHFQCYKVRRSHETPRFAAVPGVKVDDQFGTVTVTVKKPIRLCAPVDKNGEDPGAEADAVHLLCYQTSRVPFAVAYPFVDNQFGSQQMTLIRRTELCLPALLNPPSPTTSTSTTTSTSSTTTTVVSLCGNGFVNPPEQCDPPGSLTCPPSSVGGAFLACAPGCTCPASPSGAFLEVDGAVL